MRLRGYLLAFGVLCPLVGAGAQEQDTAAWRGLMQYYRAYYSAKSAADSASYADSALANALAYLRHDSLNVTAGVLGTKFLLVRGDTARAAQAQARVLRADTNAVPMLEYAIGAQAAADLMQRSGVLEQPYEHAGTLWRAYARVLRDTSRTPARELPSVVASLLRQHAQDPQFGRRLAEAFGGVGEWEGVLLVESPVAATEVASGASVVDTACLRLLFTAYRKLGRSQEEARYAKQILQRHPRDLGTLRTVFAALGDAGDWDNTVDVGRTLLAADGTAADTGYLRRLSAALLGLRDAQDWHRVVTTGRLLARLAPAVRTERSYGFTMATAYAQLRQPRAAVAVLAPLTRSSPPDPSTWLCYASVLKQAGLLGQAREAIYQAFVLDRSDPHIQSLTVWLAYARELRGTNHRQAVTEALQRAAAIAPDDPDVRTERQRTEGAGAARVRG